MTAIEAYDILNALFDGHVSRIHWNIEKAMEEHGISGETLQAMIDAGLVEVRVIGEHRHMERCCGLPKFIQEKLDNQNAHV